MIINDAENRTSELRTLNFLHDAAAISNHLQHLVGDLEKACLPIDTKALLQANAIIYRTLDVLPSQALAGSFRLLEEVLNRLYPSLQADIGRLQNRSLVKLTDWCSLCHSIVAGLSIAGGSSLRFYWEPGPGCDPKEILVATLQQGNSAPVEALSYLQTLIKFTGCRIDAGDAESPTAVRFFLRESALLSPP